MPEQHEGEYIKVFIPVDLSLVPGLNSNISTAQINTAYGIVLIRVVEEGPHGLRIKVTRGLQSIRASAPFSKDDVVAGYTYDMILDDTLLEITPVDIRASGGIFQSKKRIYSICHQIGEGRWETLGAYRNLNRAKRDKLEKEAWFFFDASADEEFEAVIGFPKSEIEDIENDERYLREISSHAYDLEHFSKTYIPGGVFKIESIEVEDA